MTGYFIGEMPVQDYLDEFLPFDDEADPSPKSPKHFHGLRITNSKEKTLYAPFIERVNEATAQGKNILPGCKIFNTSDKADRNSTIGNKNKCDLHVYQDDFDESKGPNITEAIQLNIEVKQAGSDPFMVFKERTGASRTPSTRHSGDDVPESRTVDPNPIEHPLELDAEGKVLVRGQLISYTSEIMNRQHRLHLFTILILNTKARFIRWDRSGAVVSELFDYSQNSQPLIDFFWRFGKASGEQRGFDPTVSEPTADEEELAKEYLKRWAPKDVMRPVVVFTVHSSTGPDQDRRYVAWGALATAESSIGRATRGWPVCDVETKALGFLKDAWRSDALLKETDTLQKLNADACRNVPTLVCGGDLRGQQTQTQNYAQREWNINGTARRIIKRTHTRFVVKEVGDPLSEFECSNDLLRVVYDAFLGHQDAYRKSLLLHRDISAGNILIVTENGRRHGMLNDWDLAKNTDKLTGARAPDRTGTWQFMSYRILENPDNVVHGLADDLESFLYVTLFEGLIYTRHNQEHGVDRLIRDIFKEEFPLSNGQSIGGRNKYEMISRWKSRPKCKFTSPTFMSWIQSAMIMFTDFFRARDRQDDGDVTLSAQELLALGTVESHDALCAIWDALSPGFRHSSAADKFPAGHFRRTKAIPCNSRKRSAIADCSRASRHGSSNLNGQQRLSESFPVPETTGIARDSSSLSAPRLQADDELDYEPNASDLDFAMATTPDRDINRKPLRNRPRSLSEDASDSDARPSKRLKRDNDSFSEGLTPIVGSRAQDLQREQSDSPTLHDAPSPSPLARRQPRVSATSAAGSSPRSPLSLDRKGKGRAISRSSA
ncbi:hypothetical protein HGRIS_011636 [Hohenbuehelia grisea]|uniref:Protein kinase domain-containing protein n=1 Tax=Hohenbuehelia grisea TaxID=104357 RepID=A0ABR3JVP2_9AGAR